MKKKLIFSLLVLAGVPSLSMAVDEARLLRFPATNGNEIVFSYAGDLYKVPATGGEARRLTSHVGYEMFPRFSPDGKTIAFTGQYDGNTEVYTMPVTGGEPLRVTYTATNSRDDLGDRMGPNNIVMTWTPDGSRIVYRNRISDGFSGKLFTVEKEGGLSEAIPLPEGGFCSYSPDGKQLAYNRVMREFRTWKYYKGGMADDVWIYSSDKKTVENITDNPAQDIIPMWIGDEIFFLSDRDRTMNIFVYNTKTKQTDKVTDFTEYDVKFPSANGNTIVFENGGYIYKMDAGSKKPEKVNITLTSDNIYARSEIKDGADYITEACLSPDGERLVVTARGEVFNLPVEKGVTKNITRSPGAHDRNAQWSPDGKFIVYISDATGETELYMQDATGGEHVQLTKDNDTYIRGFELSPDSKAVVYTDRKNRMNLLDVATKKVTTLLQDPMGEPRGVTFSPDSKWLTYTRTGNNEYSIVYVYNLAEKKEYPVTDKWYDSSSPVFSTDGKYLVFASARDFNPTYGSLEWNHVYNNMYGVYLTLLSKDTPSPFIEKDAEVSVAKEESKKNTSVKKEETRKDELATSAVKIDFDGITDRVVKLPVSPSYYGNFYSDGNKVYYWGRGGTRVFDLKEQKEDVVADLPEKIEDTVMAQLTGEQRKLYLANQDRIAQQVQHREAGEFKKDKLKVLAELTKLRQICCDPHLHYEDYKAGSAKLDACMELVHGALDGGHRILLFSQFTGMLDIIGKRLAKEDIAFLKLTGASSKESRAKMVAQFQAGEVPVFLISLKAGGVGLNLTAADVVIHYDPWWNVAAQDQATDRAHRIGQQHTVTVYKLIAKDTIEERIMQMQESKRDLVNSVLGGDGISSALFTREDVLALLGGDGR